MSRAYGNIFNFSRNATLVSIGAAPFTFPSTVYRDSNLCVCCFVVLLIYFDTKDINAQFVEARLTAAAANANYIYDSEKLILTNPIKNTTNSFNSVLTIGCKNAQSYTANMVAGQKVYILVNGEEGTLNDFYFQATTGSTATYTYEIYRANDKTTPVDSVTTAGQHVIHQDINGTANMYYVVTCVTAGEISITSAM